MWVASIFSDKVIMACLAPYIELEEISTLASTCKQLHTLYHSNKKANKSWADIFDMNQRVYNRMVHSFGSKNPLISFQRYTQRIKPIWLSHCNKSYSRKRFHCLYCGKTLFTPILRESCSFPICWRCHTKRFFHNYMRLSIEEIEQQISQEVRRQLSPESIESAINEHGKRSVRQIMEANFRGGGNEFVVFKNFASNLGEKAAKLIFKKRKL